MPRYLDHHPTNPTMPPETLAAPWLHAGQLNVFGERGLHVFISPVQTYCHTEAPSANAVRKAHQARGIDLDPHDVIEVQVLP